MIVTATTVTGSRGWNMHQQCGALSEVCIFSRILEVCFSSGWSFARTAAVFQRCTLQRSLVNQSVWALLLLSLSLDFSVDGPLSFCTHSFVCQYSHGCYCCLC